MKLNVISALNECLLDMTTCIWINIDIVVRIINVEKAFFLNKLNFNHPKFPNDAYLLINI